MNLMACAVYSDETEDCTITATWESLDSSIATVENGAVTGVAPGEVQIQASYQTASVTMRITVEAASVVAERLVITGPADFLDKPSTSRRGCADWSTRPSKTSSPTVSPTTPRHPSRPPRRPSPSTSWPQTRTNRRSRDGRPASSTRGGALYSKARRWPTSTRATSCAARRVARLYRGGAVGPPPGPLLRVDVLVYQGVLLPDGRVAGGGVYSIITGLLRII